MTNILIVDDEIGIRELLSEILFDEGYQVQVAESAAQARAYRKPKRTRSGICLDIWMPDTDGLTLLKEWVETRSTDDACCHDVRSWHHRDSRRGHPHRRGGFSGKNRSPCKNCSRPLPMQSRRVRQNSR